MALDGQGEQRTRMCRPAKVDMRDPGTKHATERHDHM